MEKKIKSYQMKEKCCQLEIGDAKDAYGLVSLYITSMTGFSESGRLSVEVHTAEYTATWSSGLVNLLFCNWHNKLEI